eukprot:3115005-Prymnesium_polylepis.1
MRVALPRQRASPARCEGACSGHTEHRVPPEGAADACDPWLESRAGAYGGSNLDVGPRRSARRTKAGSAPRSCAACDGGGPAGSRRAAEMEHLCECCSHGGSMRAPMPRLSSWVWRDKAARARTPD